MWTEMNRNRWQYKLQVGPQPVVTLQDAKSVGRGWRYCRGWYDGVRQSEWVYLGSSVATLEEAQATTLVLLRLDGELT